MPVQYGRMDVDGKETCFARWGEQGKKYFFPCDDSRGKARATRKAHAQGAAIRHAGGEKRESASPAVIMPRFAGIAGSLECDALGASFFFESGEEVREQEAAFLAPLVGKVLDDAGGFVVRGVLSYIDGSKLGGEDKVLEALLGAQSEKLVFFIYDVVSIGEEVLLEQPLMTRLLRMKELPVGTGLAVVAHRIAHTPEELQAALDWASAVQGATSVDISPLQEAFSSTKVSLGSAALHADAGLVELALDCGEKQWLVRLQRPQGEAALPLLTTVGNAVLGVTEKAESALPKVARGRCVVCRDRREGKPYLEIALGLEEQRDLSGIWGISGAGGDEEAGYLVMHRLTSRQPFHLRPSKSRGRREEIASLSEQERPSQETIDEVCGFAPNQYRERLRMGVSEQSGSRWHVTIIRAGVSLNGNLWGRELLSRSAHLFEGVPVNMIELVPNDPGHMDRQVRAQLPAHPVQHTVGWLEKARWNDMAGSLDGELVLADAPHLQGLLMAAESAGHKNFLGLSVDVQTVWHPEQHAGRTVRVVDEILQISTWVDVVTNPSAGGSINHAMESAPPSGGATSEQAPLETTKENKVEWNKDVIAGILKALNLWPGDRVDAVMTALEAVADKDALSAEITRSVEALRAEAHTGWMGQLTLDGLKAAKPDFFAQTEQLREQAEKEAEQKIQALSAENNQLKQEKTAAEQQLAEAKQRAGVAQTQALVAREMASSKLPDVARERVMNAAKDRVLDEPSVKALITAEESYVSTLQKAVSPVQGALADEQMQAQKSVQTKKVKSLMGLPVDEK